MINENKSFEENVKDLILSEYAPLENEINTTMKDEYSKIDKSIYLEEINQLKVANINNCRLCFFLNQDLQMIKNLIIAIVLF